MGKDKRLKSRTLFCLQTKHHVMSEDVVHQGCMWVFVFVSLEKIEQTLLVEEVLDLVEKWMEPFFKVH